MTGSITQPRRDDILYIDASAGAAGDMILGAFVDLGVPLQHLQSALRSLPIDGFEVSAQPVTRCGLAATQVEVHIIDAPSPARRMVDLERILEDSKLEEAVRDRALAVFRRLIQAEAEAHGRSVDEVHLHEAGGVDAIVDVVGACIALEFLGAPRVRVSRMTLGFGSVTCTHGVLPVPAPATLALVRGFPVYGGHLEAERLTPTGAALLTTLADEWGSMPSCQPTTTGVGAGSRDFENTPNCVRMVLAERPEALGVSEEGVGTTPHDRVTVIECTLDDSTPQVLAYTSERLLRSGALDVFIAAVTMKKGRPGHNLTILSQTDDVATLTAVLLSETSTLGLRFRQEHRMTLERSWTPVETPWGTVRIKTGSADGVQRNAWPEYEDCAEHARREDVPLRDIQFAAMKAFDNLPAAGSQRQQKPTQTDSLKPRRPTNG